MKFHRLRLSWSLGPCQKKLPSLQRRFYALKMFQLVVYRAGRQIPCACPNGLTYVSNALCDEEVLGTLDMVQLKVSLGNRIKLM